MVLGLQGQARETDWPGLDPVGCSLNPLHPSFLLMAQMKEQWVHPLLHLPSSHTDARLPAPPPPPPPDTLGHVKATVQEAGREEGLPSLGGLRAQTHCFRTNH